MQIGPELEESARVSGAGWLRTYWRVLLPLIAPTAITVGLLSFLSAIRDISTPVLLYSAQSRPLSILCSSTASPARWSAARRSACW